MTPPPAFAQTDGNGVACIPVSERARREFGCFILATQIIGPLDSAHAFWHLSTFATRSAADAAAGPHGKVVEALGTMWLLTIAGARWRPSQGTHVAAIGPLPVARGVAYTAQYMEAVLRPGMKSLVHRHSGPEAWYTLAGETCLETPAGTLVGRAGGSPIIVAQGPPMELTATGTDVRRALVLIIHDAAQPATSPAPDWRPKGLCKV
jgi:quercetin dioxygenase-like cupin family protein